MKTLLSLCLYLVLLNSVTSLTCYSCMLMGKTCEHPVAKESDSDENSCASAVAEGSLDIFSMNMIVMTSVESQYCRSGYYSTSISDSMQAHSNLSCCETDNCNNVTVTIPSTKDKTPNGLTCPSCYSLHLDHCKARDTVKCLGKEDHCFYYGVILHNGTHTHNSAAQGCTTQNACAFKKGVVHAANHSLKANITRAECYPAKSHSSNELPEAP